MQLWELLARESVRDTITRYNNAGDRGAVEEMAETFCADGVLETGRDRGRWVGREAITHRLGGNRGRTTGTDTGTGTGTDTGTGTGTGTGTDSGTGTGTGFGTGRRHVVTNIHFDELTTDAASVSSYFTVLSRRGLDHFGRYHDRLVPVGDRWLFAHRTVVRDWQRADRVQPLG